MKTILDTIIDHKHTEVAARKQAMPEKILQREPLFARTCLPVKPFLLDPERTGIIAEFKRQSPSKGVINDKVEVVNVTGDYTRFGASCLSVLTDEKFFGGTTNDLIRARVNPIPILRKDFVIDEYQIVEAKAMGADLILLIAACLSPAEVARLAKFARALGLDILLELHAEAELEHICDEIELIGINNRNLKTFEVDIDRSLRMAEKLPARAMTIAESGISTTAAVRLFKQHGFSGFLMGENFMKEADPGQAFAKFARELKTA